jgi:hypothetical protein
MKTRSIHLRKVLILGASTVAVMAAAAPAWADYFVLDYWDDGSFVVEVVNGGTTPPAPPPGSTLISEVDASATPLLSGSGSPVGAPGPVPGAGLLSLAFFILAGVKTKLREIAALARQTRARSMPA